MKTFLKIVIPIAIIGGIIYYAFRTVEPVDDTKKLYIVCNDNKANYDLYSGKEVVFAKSDKSCKLDLKIENVDRTYLKLKASNVFLVGLDGNHKIDQDTSSHDIFVLPEDKLTLYSEDEKTKFIFEYK